MFPLYGIFGILLIVVSEIFMLQGVWFFSTYFTPIAWTGYILFIDAMNYHLHGNSLINNRSQEFLLMLPWSVFCWLIFEGYNLYLQNWSYIGLPKHLILRTLGFVWSFATIFPGIFETAELIQPFLAKIRTRQISFTQRALMIQIVIGFLCLTLPMLVTQEIAKYLFALVWLGFVFLLEPINYLLGGRSLFQHFEQGDLSLLLSLISAGAVCGFLWEFWNYWAQAKWSYTLSTALSGPKIFEMPLLGFLGFLPFAVECYSLQNFLMLMVEKKFLFFQRS